jgi:hypothetical protein
MRFSLVTIGALLLVAPATWSQTPPGAAAVTGSWVGESKCTAPDSPCRDEHVVHRITADKRNPAQLSIDADKIVDGTPQFMGTIVCQYHADQATLSCTSQHAQAGRLAISHLPRHHGRDANDRTGEAALPPHHRSQDQPHGELRDRPCPY